MTSPLGLRSYGVDVSYRNFPLLPLYEIQRSVLGHHLIQYRAQFHDFIRFDDNTMRSILPEVGQDGIVGIIIINGSI